MTALPDYVHLRGHADGTVTAVCDHDDHPGLTLASTARQPAGDVVDTAIGHAATSHHAPETRNVMVDAAAAHAHVRALMAAGMGHHRIADRAGVSRYVVDRLLWGHPRKRVPARTMYAVDRDALLRVTLDLHPRALVDATGTIRRVRGLAAQGHSLVWQSRQAGYAPGRLTQSIAHAEGAGRVRVALADAIAKIAAEHETCWPWGAAAARARGYAQRRGWPPLLAWPEDRIDDPAARPEYRRGQ